MKWTTNVNKLEISSGVPFLKHSVVIIIIITIAWCGILTYQVTYHGVQMSTWSGANLRAWRTTSTSRHWIQTTTTSSTSLDVRHTRLSTVGDRAFPVAAARLWNSLPCHCCPLSPSSAVRVLNHISSHFLIPLSDSSLICTVHAQWLVILDTIIDFTLNILTSARCTCSGKDLLKQVRPAGPGRLNESMKKPILFCRVCRNPFLNE